jgi:peptidyl-prolyl cis-trans isomerase B (cyclophilin B)
MKPSKLACLLALFASAPAAQDIPGVTVKLVPEQSSLSASQDVVLRLVLEVQQDAEVPGALLTGVQFDTRIDDQPGPQIREGGKGGPVPLAAGTRIERTIKLPASKVKPAGGNQGLVHIALQWPGLTGANCVVQLAPDLSKVDLVALDLAKTRVVLVTNFGEMTIAFHPDRAPETVKNFVKLAKDGFFDGTKFHRVIRNFMIQGGDPLTKDDKAQERWGTGDPGYKIRGEVNSTKHVRGVLSMANSGSPDTAGSQFFICHRDAPHLDSGYTAFAALENGLDVLDKIASVPCGGPERSRPLTPVVLQHALVLPAYK